MSNEKLVKTCPVCHSDNVVQDSDSPHFTMHTVIGGKIRTWRDGSHCENCGSKFVFNHISEEEFRKPEQEAKEREFNEMCGNIPFKESKVERVKIPKDVDEYLKRSFKK